MLVHVNSFAHKSLTKYRPGTIICLGITRQGWAGQNLPTTMPSRIFRRVGRTRDNRDEAEEKPRSNIFSQCTGTTNILTSHSLPPPPPLPTAPGGGGNYS
jgi:hypothetical protein